MQWIQSVILTIAIFALTACGQPIAPQERDVGSNEIILPNEQNSAPKDSLDIAEGQVTITVGERAFSAVFYDNPLAKEIMAQMPITLDMKDFAGQEKVAELSFDLPHFETETPPSIKAGELYIWSKTQLVLFYTSLSENDYSYGSIGYVEDIDGLVNALGSGRVEVSFSVK